MINIELYKTIIELCEIKLTNEQIVSLIEKLKIIIDSKEEFEKKLDNLFNSLESISKKEDVKNKIFTFLENTLISNESFIILKLSLNLIRLKKFILEKSKLISETFKVSNNIHIMDFKYDYNMMLLPYSFRSSGSLFFEGINKSTDSIYDPIKEDLSKLKNLDPDIMLQIIYAESASQSIKSTSGSSYESRFENLLKIQGIEYSGHSHDSKIKSVEYDFKILLNDNKIGVSLKRTLRERYKQNHENIDYLDVDTMFLVTLGIDLNEKKINYITNKKGQYIFVATDIYNSKDYLKNHPNVYPLSELTNDLIQKILDQRDS